MGHITRCAIISNYLSEYYKVYFIIDKNKKNKVYIKNKVTLIYKTLKKNISVEKKYILEKKPIANFKNYDLIISDNLIEPIFNTNKVILLSTFFWHDIFDDVKAKKKFLKNIKNSKIKILRNYMFSFKNYIKFLPIPFVGKFNKNYNKSKKNILISFGTAEFKEKKSF